MIITSTFMAGAWPVRYSRTFSRRERSELIAECSRRTGLSAAHLEAATLQRLRALLDATRHELLVHEDEARAALDPDEMPRVRDFFAGEERARSLLDGLIPASAFYDCFLIWSGDENVDLVRHGRSLRRVIETIGADGGLAASAQQVPWLASAARMENFSLDRMHRQRIFVRHAVPHEALHAPSTCVNQSHPMYIEEGSHRAIAAAWALSRGGTQEPDPLQLIAYLRGVNRRGKPDGAAFWRVHGRNSADYGEYANFPIAELCSGALCVALVWSVAHWGRARHKRRRVREL